MVLKNFENYHLEFLKLEIQVEKRVSKTHFAVFLSWCGGNTCHADLESLRLEICLIESRVSKTRDSIIYTFI